MTIALISLLSILCFLLGVAMHYLYSRKQNQAAKDKIRHFSSKAEKLSLNYDDYRRKYLDLDDRFQEVKNMEQTYRVAYLEWKDKYESLKDGASTFSLEQTTTQSTPTYETDDYKILYINWKKKAKKLTKKIETLEGKTIMLQKTSNLQKREIEEMAKWKDKWSKLREGLSILMEEVPDSHTFDFTSSESQSEVFDLEDATNR